MNRQFMSRRVQMAFVAGGLWFLLALWSLSAFWAHIDSLGANYQLAAKCGAMAGEFTLLALVLWHCFDKHIGVRRWALILGFILAAVILVHAGALRGVEEAKAARIDTEDRLAQRLTAMSKDQAAAIGAANASTVANAPTQKERMALARSTAAEQGDVARAAQQTLATEIAKTDSSVRAVSILPDWYLNGWCYSLLFILSLAFVGIIFLMMMNGEDIDENFDNIPDREQGGLVAATQTTTTVTPVPAPVTAAPRPAPAVWSPSNQSENERGN